MKRSIFESSSLLRTAFFSGFMMLIILGGVLALLYTSPGASYFRAPREEIGFRRLLSDYDLRYGLLWGDGPPGLSFLQLESLGRDLDHIETRAEVVENWLSVLKRRRQLAAHARAVPGAGPRHAQAHVQSALRALRDFPFSEPIAVVAAGAIVHEAAITMETEEKLREILPLLTGARFIPMYLSLHVLLGDFQNSRRAAESLSGSGRLPLDFVISAMGQHSQELLTSLVILRALDGEIWEALSAVHSVLARGDASPEFIRFAAEFLYDFGGLSRSAELFHMLPDAEAWSRQADALWLAGYTGLARHVWELLVEPRTEFLPAAADLRNGADLESRALYNLAITAESAGEAKALLERLVAQSSPGDMFRELGFIRLTRFMDAPRAVTVLEAERGVAGFAGGFPVSALIDLEILKRRTEMGEAGRIVAETWMLLHRYPDAEGLYEWAAWLFDLQRNFTESDMLLRTAERQGFSGHWKRAHQALRLIREGDLESATGAIEAIQAESDNWALSANLGRIFEARNASARALEHYQMALALLMETEAPGMERRETASQLQFRIARCLRTLGRMDESRRALLLALELNPNNLNARLELGRM